MLLTDTFTFQILDIMFFGFQFKLVYSRFYKVIIFCFMFSYSATLTSIIRQIEPTTAFHYLNCSPLSIEPLISLINLVIVM